jgi:hypothetical protein
VAESSPHLFSCRSINRLSTTFLNCGFVQTAFLAESHKKSNIEYDARQAQHSYNGGHNELNLPAGLPT